MMTYFLMTMLMIFMLPFLHLHPLPVTLLIKCLLEFVAHQQSPYAPESPVSQTIMAATVPQTVLLEIIILAITFVDPLDK